MSVCFIANLFGSKASGTEMLYGAAIPSVPEGSLSAMIGLIGSVIMPHNFYLHSSLVLTRKINIKCRNAVNEANIYNTIESSMSLFISFIINMAVIGTFAAYVIHSGHADDPEYELDLLSASKAL
jgi:natural resistance-associated macrophage protein 2